MKRTYLILSMLMLSLSSAAQEPELLTDLNAAGDGLSEFYYSTAYLGDQLLFPLDNGETGIELGTLINGELSVLKDINPGIAESRPVELTNFQGKVYFSAEDIDNGGGLWVTDGTEAGTELIFTSTSTSTSRPAGLQVARNGLLYFAIGSNLYRTNGTTAGTEMIAENAGLAIDWQHQSPNYCLYENGIAYVVRYEGKASLFAADESAVLLAQTEGIGNFADLYGMAEVDGGLVFAIADSFTDDVSAVYRFDEDQETLEKAAFNGEVQLMRRFIPLGGQYQIGYINGDGFYSFMANGPSEKILEGTPEFNVQGVPIVHTYVSDKVLFRVRDTFPGGEEIGISDGTPAGTRLLFTTEESYLTNMITYGEKAYVVTGTSNGFQQEFHVVDGQSEEVTHLYTSEAGSSLTRSVILIGIQDNRLYFAGNFDEQIGREMYSMDISAVTSNEAPEATPYEVLISENHLLLKGQTATNFALTFFDLQGREISQVLGVSNEPIELPFTNFGLYRLVVDGQVLRGKF